jgi:hypothetical protein
MSPYPVTDDELLLALRERTATLVDPEDPSRKRCPFATPDDIADAESQLGFRLPPLLPRVYEIANGGIGPGVHGLLSIGEGDDTLVTVYRSIVDSTCVPKPGEPGFDQYPWPKLLLPICDWGCAIWSCLDCRSDGGAIVTASNGEPFANTGHMLRSWLSAWLAGADLFEEMFEPGPNRTGINPFTKQTVVLKSQGKPRGARWP